MDVKKFKSFTDKVNENESNEDQERIDEILSHLDYISNNAYIVTEDTLSSIDPRDLVLLVRSTGELSRFISRSLTVTKY